MTSDVMLIQLKIRMKFFSGKLYTDNRADFGKSYIGQWHDIKQMRDAILSDRRAG